MTILHRATLSLIAGVLCTGITSSRAAVLDAFADLPAFLAAAGSGVPSTQSFQGFALGADVTGIEVLPGVSASFNLGELNAINAGNRRLLGGGNRTARNAQYDITLALPYTSFAFEIAAFQADDDPNSQNTAATDAPGIVTVEFDGGSSQTVEIFGNDGSPIFVGLVADMPIVNVSWAEALTKSGLRNEASTLDNFTVLSQVPAPGTLVLAALGLVGVTVRHAKWPSGALRTAVPV